MIEKLWPLALLLAAPGPADEAMPSPFFVNLNLVEQIRCGARTGTAAWIDGDTLLTAAHVTVGGDCVLDGLPAATIHQDLAKDIAVLRPIQRSGERMAISCERPRAGLRYYAVGWALGSQFVVQRYLGTNGKRRDGLTTFKGNAFPGMSGGPIVDDDGQIVGVLTAGLKMGLGNMFGRALADTYICEESK